MAIVNSMELKGVRDVLKKVWKWVLNTRLVDSHLGILCLHLWIRILANYGGIVYIFKLGLNIMPKPQLTILYFAVLYLDYAKSQPWKLEVTLLGKTIQRRWGK